MKKKTVIGAVIMAAAILIALPLGLKSSLERLREEASGSYFYDSTGYAIFEGVDFRNAQAKNLITLANKYAGDNPDLAVYIDNLDYLVKLQESVRYGDYVSEADYNQKIGEAAQELFKQLQEIELSEKDSKYPQQIIANMRSEQDKLERSSYNDDALAFNAKLEEFPVNLLNPLLQVQPLGVYRSMEKTDVASVQTEN